MDGARHTATASEIRAILGDLDDAAISAILDTGASPAEITEAFMRKIAATAEDERGTACSGTVAAVLDILEDADAEPEEP